MNVIVTCIGIHVILVSPTDSLIRHCGEAIGALLFVSMLLLLSLNVAPVVPSE